MPHDFVNRTPNNDSWNLKHWHLNVLFGALCVAAIGWLSAIV